MQHQLQEDRAKQLGYNCHVWSHQIQGEARLLGQAYAKLAHTFIQCKLSVQTQDSEQLFLPLLEEEVFQELFTLFPELREDFVTLSRILSLHQDHSCPLCLISSGEPTVTVRGSGKGGRNQELALSFGIELQQQLQLSKTPSHLVSSLKTAGNIDDDEGHPHCVFLSIGTDGQDGPCDAAGAVVDMETIAVAYKQGIDPVKYLDDNDSYSFFSSLSEGRYLIKTGLTGTNVMDLHIMLLYPRCH